MNTYNLSSKGALSQNSSGGKLLKWNIGNKFIKTSTFDQTQIRPVFLYESYAEVIVYKIAKQLGLNAIPYRLCRIIIDGYINTIACECDNFIQPNEQYISIGKLMLEGKLNKPSWNGINDYENLISELSVVDGFKSQLGSTLFLDSLVLNDDRHYGNFGLLQNNIGVYKVAPIFDNGNSLLCHKHTDEIEYKRDLISYLRCKPFVTDFNEQLKYAKLIELADRKLKSYITTLIGRMVSDYELPTNRGKFIKDLLNDRIDYIINLEQGAL